MRRPYKQILLAGGIVGPLAFVGAWSLLGTTTGQPYSPFKDAISRLAAMEAPTRPGMTFGFVVFGIGVPMFGLALRDELPGSASIAAVATGVATLAAATAPLGVSATVDRLHGASATIGYATLALTPWLAAPHLNRSARIVSRSVAIASATALAATVVAPWPGLMQRVGLTLGDAWIVAAAIALLRRSRRNRAVRSDPLGGEGGI